MDTQTITSQRQDALNALIALEGDSDLGEFLKSYKAAQDVVECSVVYTMDHLQQIECGVEEMEAAAECLADRFHPMVKQLRGAFGEDG